MLLVSLAFVRDTLLLLYSLCHASGCLLRCHTSQGLSAPGSRGKTYAVADYIMYDKVTVSKTIVPFPMILYDALLNVVHDRTGPGVYRRRKIE